MKIARIITIVAFILHSWLAAGAFSYPGVISILESAGPAILPIYIVKLAVIEFLLVVGSLIFWWYLRAKDKKGEKVKYAILYSLGFILAWVVLLIYIPSKFQY